MKYVIQKILIVIITLAALTMPAQVLASSESHFGASSVPTVYSSGELNCNDTDLNTNNCGIVALLNTIFNFISGGVTLAIVGNIIFAGIQYSTAQGDPSTASKSKKRIQDALIAFLMYACLYAFIQWLIPGGVF